MRSGFVIKKRGYKSGGTESCDKGRRMVSATSPGTPAPILDEKATVFLTRTDFWLLVLMTLGGFLLRFYRIDFREPHMDEMYTMKVMQAPLWRDFFLSLLTVDCHPPINYLIQKFVYWIQPTIVSVRMVSVFFGTAIIPALFWAFRPLLGSRVALVSSFLGATSYVMIWYSRVARNYALFFFLSILMFGFFMRLLNSSSKRDYIRNIWGFSLASVICLYVHHTCMLMFPIFATIFVLWEFMNRQFRWTVMKHLILVAVVLAVFSIPIFYQLKAWSFIHFSSPLSSHRG